jgi:hypothetical protein
MTKLPRRLHHHALALASLGALALPAQAVDYTWSSGYWTWGDLGPADTLTMLFPANNKFINVVRANAGRINATDTLAFQSGAVLANSGLYDLQADVGLVNGGGANSSFHNTGILRKSAGLGSSSVGSIAFVNSGTIDVQTGTLAFSGGQASFNAGSRFTGAGTALVNSAASFQGGFSSANLTLAAGVFSGSAAQVQGEVAFTGGTLAGSWEIAANQLLSGRSGLSKTLAGAALVNNGNLVWLTGDALQLQSGSHLTNSGLHDIRASSAITNAGGSASGYTNTSGATLRVAAGQLAEIGSIAFVNAGGLLTADGTLVFGGGQASFDDGTRFGGVGSNLVTSHAGFHGAITSGNLVLQRGNYAGGDAVLGGTTTFSGGAFRGTWALAPGQLLDVRDGADKRLDGAAFTNQGTARWRSSDPLLLQSGASLVNRGLFDMQVGMALDNSGGAMSVVVNSGTLRVADGQAGRVGAVAFVNEGGALDVSAGATLDFSGGHATFLGGTRFTGAGNSLVSHDARFIDDIRTQNLRLVAGNVAGGNGSPGSKAVVSGQLAFAGGALLGHWELAPGHTLLGQDGGAKRLSGATVVNKSSILWQSADPLLLQSGANLVNQGMFSMLSGMALDNAGGSMSAVVNSGTLRVADGQAGRVGAIAFVNDGGVLDVGTGATLAFGGGNATFNAGSRYSGAGTVAVTANASFNGLQATDNLWLGGGQLVGGAAVLQGRADFSGGMLQGGWTVADGAQLRGLDGAGKVLGGATLTNLGTLAWQTGNPLSLQSGALLVNQQLLDVQQSMAVVNGGGAMSVFINHQMLRVAAGQTATIGAVQFINDGTLDVAGTLAFNGGLSTFNAGSRFAGAGTVVVNSNAAFNGAQGSDNLALRGGSLVGGAAVLGGQVTFSGGTLLGGWTLAPGARLQVADGDAKRLSGATFANQGSIAWQTDAPLLLQSGASLLNQGRLEFLADGSLVNGGGSTSVVVNTGAIVKSGGTGITAIGPAVVFDNQGVVDVRTGTVALPANFANAGTLTGTGTFAVSGTLTNQGRIAPGASTGPLTIDGRLVLAAASTLDIGLESLASHDRLVVQGDAVLGGLLAVSCVGSCSFAAGQEVRVLDATGSLGGSFAGLTATGFNSDAPFVIRYDLAGADVWLAATRDVTAVPEPASPLLLTGGLALLGWLARRRRGQHRGLPACPPGTPASTRST